MYDFYIYQGKNNNESINNDYGKLQKCSEIIGRISKELPGGMSHKLFFDNCFSTLDLMLYLKSQKRFLAVGTIRLNRLEGCSMDENKSLQKKVVVQWIIKRIAIVVLSSSNGSPCQSKSDSNKRSQNLVISYWNFGTCIDISEALIYIHNTSRNQWGRPSKRKSVKLTPRGKGPEFIYLLLIYITTDYTTGQFPLHKKIVADIVRWHVAWSVKNVTSICALLMVVIASKISILNSAKG